MARLAVDRPKAGAWAFPVVVATMLRRLRAEVPLVATVVAVVLVTSFVFSAAPRLFNAMSEDGLQYNVAQAHVLQRNLLVMRGDTIPPGPPGEMFASVDQAGATFQEGLPASIRSIIDQRTFVIDSVRYRFPEEPGGTLMFLTLRQQSGIDAYIHLVDGRLPDVTDQVVQPTAESGTTPAGPVPLFEVAMSEDTARELHLGLGDRVVLGPDHEDRLARSGGGLPAGIAVEVVGLIETQNQDDDYWYGDPRLQTPSVYDDGNQVRVYGTALFAAADYPRLLEATSPANLGYSWRYYVDPRRFTVGGFGVLWEDVKRLNATYGSAYLSRVTETGVTTGLAEIFDRYAQQRRLTGSILSLAAIALFTIALAVIGLVAALISERRREMYLLVRGRGASGVQLLGVQAVEGLLLGLPAALLGYALAVVLVDAAPSRWSTYAALGIAVATAGLLVAAAVPLARRNLRTLEREDITRPRLSPRRLAAEVFIVALAVAGIYLLRRRGLAGDSATAEAGGFDPYLAAVPILLGLATGLAVLRLYAIPVRVLAWAASLRRDLVPFVGLRRIARQSAVTAVPLLVLLLAIAVGVFSSIMLHTIEVGQVRTSWEQVGADYRIDSPLNAGMNPNLDLNGIPGVEAAAFAYRDDVLAASESVTSSRSVALLAIQPAAYEEVTAGTPAEPRLPAALLAAPQAGELGTPGNPIPAIVSSRPLAGRVLSTGDTFGLQFERGTITFVVSEVRDRFPGLVVDLPFVVTSLDHLDAVDPRSRPGRTRLYLRASESAHEAIDEELEARRVLGSLASRDRVYARVHDAPLVAGAVSGFGAGIAVAAAYSALAVVVGLALTGRARARDLGYLRTLGLSSRQVVGLTAVEQAPPVILALAAGVALGVGVMRLIEPGVDFTAFTGPSVPVSLVIDWWTVALLCTGLVVIVAAAVAVVGVLAERMNLGGVLRLGER